MYQTNRRYFTNCILQTADISCSTSAFLKLKNIARNTNYFIKKFTNYWYGEWLLVNKKVILMLNLD